MTTIAILVSALAAALLVRGPSIMPGPSTMDGPGSWARGAGMRRTSSSKGILALAAVVGAVLVASVEGLRLVLALILACAASGVAGLVARGRRRKVADARQAKVVEVCEALVGELRAGQPLVRCLERCREVWPEFEPVVAAGRLGADVPAAMRGQAVLPGADGLREVAAAWQISQGSGAGLALALGQVAGSAREAQATSQLVRSELASAQATARLVAALPLGALAMSAGIGADPWQFLLDSPVGLACLGIGLALAYAGLAWIDRIAMAVLHG